MGTFTGAGHAGGRLYAPRLRVVLATALIAVSVAIVVPQTALQAAVVDPFIPPAFTTNANGTIDIIGNTLMTCPATSPNCAPTQAGTLTANNGSFAMQLIDRDTFATTTNSSMARLTLPAGSTVLWAGLYWGASSAAANRNTLSFRPPGAAAYTTVTADNLAATGNIYVGFENVTATVVAAGSGDYWAGNIQATTGVNTYAGWSLVVVYQNPALPMRNLTVFDGLAVVRNTVADRTVDIPVSGFVTPPLDPVIAEVGVVAFEGDRGLTGDQLLLSNNLAATTFTALSNAQNPATDFFNSSITDNGVTVTDGDPAYVNTLSIDVDEVNTVGILPNGATSAVLRNTTSGDTYYPAVVTFAVDIFAPNYPETTKTVADLNGGLAEPGDVLEYAITATNIGRDFADNTVISDVIPTGTTFVPGSITVDSVAQTDAVNTGPTDFGDFTGASVVTRVGTGATGTTGGTLAPTQTAVVTFRVTIDAAAAGTTVTNTGAIDYTARTLAQKFTFTTNTVATPVTTRADLTVTKTGAPSPVVAGTDATWTVTVSNAGPNPATDVTLTDLLPAGTSLVSVTGAACSGTTTLTCPLGTLAVGSTTTITIVTTVPADTADGAVVTNTANISSTTQDPNLGGESAAAALLVVANADLSIVKTASPDPVVPGASVTYTLTAGNAGPSTAVDVIVADTMPAGATITAITPSPAATCGAASCTFPTLAPGGSATVTIVATVDSTLSGSLVNTASVSATTVDPATANNVATITTSLAPSADLGITKTTLDAPVVAGETVRYQIRVTNSGPSAASNVTVTDVLPSSLSLLSTSTPIGSCTGSPTITCSLGTVGAGVTIDIVVEATVLPDTTGNLVNTATVSTTTSEPGGGAPNTSTVTDPVVVVPDLRITKTVSANPLVVGTPYTYTLTVFNDGPSAATGGFTVSDPVPAGLTVTTVSPGSPTCTVATNTVTCAFASLAVGASTTVTISGDVTAAGLIDNVATVTSNDSDPALSNNTATASSSLVTEADVVIDKEWSTASITAGAPATFTLTVTNAGPSAADAVTVSDTLPAGFTLVSVSGATCSGTTTVTCLLGTMASGGSIVITVTVATDPTLAAGPVTNTATVTSTTDDRNPSNNTDTDGATVARLATLTLDKTASAPTALAGGQITYTATVANPTGPSSAEATFIGDPLPPGLTIVSASSGCTIAGGTVICDLGTLGPGASATISYTVQLDPSLSPGDVLVNTAQATSITPLTGPATDSASVTVVTEADLTLVKSASPATLTPGGGVVYTLTLSNAGPSDARDVVVDDPPPAGVTVTSAVATIGTCTLAVSCTIGTLPVGGEVIITIIGTIDPAYPDPTLTNTATATSSTPDPTPATAAVTSPVAPQADLTVTKSASTASIEAGGGSVTYTITVVNAGPSTATGVVLTDTLPAGFVVTSATSTSGTCTLAGVCTLGAVGPNDPPVVIAIAGYFPSTTPAGPTTNTATATSATPLVNTADDTASVDVLVTTSADLVTSKAASIPVATAGSGFDYAITVENQGPSLAQSVTLTDTLPSGVTAGIVTTTAGSCTVVAGTLSCSFGDLPVGGLVVVTVAVTVDASVTPGPGALVNQATAASATADPDQANNTDTATVDVLAVSDLSILKTGPATIVAGENPGATYTITVTNGGPSLARDVVVDDPPVTDLIVVSVSSSVGACTGFPCALGDLAPGATATITVVARVDQATAPTTLTNTATVTTSSVDPDPADNTSSVTSSVITEADVEMVSKVDTPDPAVAGETITYTLTATNNGPSQAAAVTIVDTLPAGVTVVVASLPADCVEGVGTVTCTVSSLDALATATRTFTVTVDPGTPSGTVLTNTATVSSTTTDPDLGNQAAIAQTTIGTSADLSITKSAAPSPVVAGEPLSYTITVSNAGPSVAQAVTVTDTLPSGLSNAVVASSLGGCLALPCLLGAIAPAGSATVTITADVDPGVTTDLVNTAAVSSTTPDPDLANNSTTITTPVVTSADLSIVKTITTSPLVPGQPVTFELTVTNAGPSAAQTVSVSDALPVSLLNAVVAPPYDDECPIAASVVTCSFATVAPGSFTIVVTADLDEAATGTLANTATVVSPTPDPDLTNNASSASGPIEPSADVRIAKTGTAVVAGEQITYTITVTNDGPSTATGVVVDDILPAGLSGVTVTSSQGGCTALPCTIGTLSSGGSATVTITATVDADVVDLDPNTAVVSATTPDPDLTNNTATADPPVATLADLSVTKTVDSTDLVAGLPVVWTITIENAGPSVAANVTLTDVLPAGLANVAVSGGGCTALPCVVGALAPGTVAVTISADVISTTLATSITNTATVSSSTADPDTDDLTASVTSSVRRDADLSLTKVPVAGTGTVGEDIAYDITVSNAGPSAARDVVLIDPAPVGTSVTSATVTTGTADCSATTALVATCDRALLDVGESFTVRLVLSTDTSLPEGTTIVNDAALSSSTPDSSPGNNTVTADPIVLTRIADLAVTKTVSPVSVDAGETATWTVTVTNLGPSDVDDVTLTDVVPSGFEVTAVTSTPAGVCTLQTGQPDCGLFDLVAGGTLVVTITGRVLPGELADLVNVASVAATTTDPDPANSTASATLGVTTSAAIVVDKVAPAVVSAGDPIAWTIDVVNLGPSVARTVVLDDVLPAGISGVTVSGACTAFPCALGDLDPDVTLTITVTAIVDPGQVADLVNTATVTSPTAPAAGDDRSDETTTAVTQVADLQVTKDLVQDPAVPGMPLRWIIAVTNLGPSNASGVVVADTLPGGLSNIVISASQGGCAALPCPLGAIAAGGTATITVDADLDASVTATEIANTATVTADTADDDATNNTATATDAVVPAADLRIDKNGTSGTVVPGLELGWTITIVNDGPSDAQNVAMTDTLPTALDATTIVVDAGGSSCTLTGLQLDCTVATLADGDTVTVTVTGQVRADFAGETLDNTAVVAADTADPDTTDNTDSASAPNAPLANVVVGGSVTPATVAAGTSATWRFTIGNEGPSDAAATIVTIPIPASLSIVGTPTLVGAPPGATVTVVAGQLVIDLGSLPAGSSVELSFVTAVDPTQTPGTLSLTATATTTTNQTATADDAVTVGLEVVTDVGLSITKTIDSATVQYGDVVTFTIVVTNGGSSTATGVQVSDPVPDDLADVAFADPDGRCAATGNTVDCSEITIPPGGSYTITVTARAIGNGAGENVATVSNSDSPDDLIGSAAYTIERHSALAVAKTVDDETVTVGATVTYTIVVTNDGPDPAVDVVVIDQLPDGLNDIGAVALAGTYDPSTGTWSIGELAAGTTATLYLTATVTGTGAIINTVTLSSTVIDGTDGNISSVTLTSSSAGLPVTGSNIADLFLLGLELVLAGLVLVTLTRRRKLDVR